jgi:hypothetical protein
LPLPLDLVPRFATVASAIQRRVVHGKRLLTRVRTNPSEFLDYGAFQSFAPVADSSRATLSRAESLLVKLPGRRVYLEEMTPLPDFKKEGLSIFRGELEKEVPRIFLLPSAEDLKKLEQSTSTTENNFSGLKKEGIDVEALQNLINLPKELLNSEGPLPFLLLKNNQLLAKLLFYQEERFKSRSQHLSSLELEAGKSLFNTKKTVLITL